MSVAVATADRSRVVALSILAKSLEASHDFLWLIYEVVLDEIRVCVNVRLDAQWELRKSESDN